MAQGSTIVGSRRERVRKRAGAAVVDGLFKSASRMGRWLPAARPATHGVEVVRDVPYVDSGDRLHHLDVYRPVRPPPEARDPRTGRLPAILYLHGGGFRMLSKDSHWLPGLIFARRGYVVFNASYRLAPRDPFPAAVQDAAAALQWVAAHAAEYGADAERIGIAGESAGANLTAALAVCTSWRRPEPWARAVFDAGITPKAVLPAMGILQVSDPDRFRRRKPLPPWVVDRIEEVTEAYLPRGEPHDLADPLLVFEGDSAPDRPLPPFHAACGTADPLIDDTRRLAAALAARGVPHEVSYWPGGVHAFHMFVFLEPARRLWQEILTFSHKHVAGIEGPLRPMPWVPPVP
ncbi:MAG: alpha/beta hydrolase [Myxococcota bacterium]